MINLRHLCSIIAAAVMLAGCVGGRTFHDYARAGDTIAVATGWKHHFQRSNIEVTITDNASTVTTYSPGSTAVRGSINFYPDPVSGLVLSDRLNTNASPFAKTYAGLVNSETTNDDRDWWETVVFVDLPDPMALGDATITITDLGSSASETSQSIVTIVPDDMGQGTGGTSNIFHSTLGAYAFDMQNEHFQSLERTPHYVVTFSGATVPDAIQVELTHAADAAHNGTGIPYVVNPIGTVKNLSWAPTGTSGTDLRVIMTPATDGEIKTMNDFKFYVAGGINGVAVVDQDTINPGLDVNAYDSGGFPVTGVTANVEFIDY